MEYNEINNLINDIEAQGKAIYTEIENIALYNQKKVLDAFKKNHISPQHFNPTNGYGYDDVGRDKLSKVFSDIFHTEDAIISPLIVNGTHALTLTLFGLLRPNDTLLSISGKPYDTLDNVINGENNGSLKEFGIKYYQIEYMHTGTFDNEKIYSYVNMNKPKVVFLQRSKGYLWRKATSIKEFEEVIKLVKKANYNSIVVVDNCYGEFVEKYEPTDVGADIVVGSLIKNIGGGLAPTGGYIAGKSNLVDMVAKRMTSPSLGNEVGSYFASYLPFFQGLFLAPSTVKNAMKGCILSSFAFSRLKYETLPQPNEMPRDIICAIKLKNRESLIRFCQIVQELSPVDSYLTLEPWDMPGYNHQVIMAAGTFVQGASLELTADAPIKEPYIGYLQGGLTYEHYKIAIIEILKFLSNIN